MMDLRGLRILPGLVGLVGLLSISVQVDAQFRGSGRNRNGFDRRGVDTVIPNAAQTERDTKRTDASSAYQKKNYVRTLEITGDLLATDPNDFVALHLQAASRIDMGIDEGSPQKIREGIEDARRSLGLAGQKYAWLYVPYIYGLSSLAEIEGRPEHADMAITVVAPILTRTGISNNDLGSLFYQRALCYAAKGEAQLAINDLTESIKKSPDLLAAHLRRAELMASAKQVKEATEAFDALVHAFPNSQLAYNYRGKFRRDQRNLDGAVADFSVALRLQENESDYVNRGMCLLESNEPLAAEGDFTQALKLNSKLDFAYRLRGSSRLAEGHLDAALQDFDAALKLSPGDLLTVEERGFAKYFKKDYAGAAADFDKVLIADPNAFRLAQWLYMAYVRDGKAAEATRLLDSRLKGKIPPQTWQATMCSYLQDRSTEQQLLEAAKDKDIPYQSNKRCEANYFIGQRKAAAGKAEEAKVHFREAEKMETAFQLAAYRGSRYELGSFKK